MFHNHREIIDVSVIRSDGCTQVIIQVHYYKADMFLPFPLRLEEDIQIRITEKLVHIFHVVILTENKNSFLRGSESD